MNLFLLMLTGCGDPPLIQAGHRLDIRQSQTWSLGNGTRHRLELRLDGQPLELEYWFHPLSPPASVVPRTVYFGDGWKEETWPYDRWQSFQIAAGSPAQHQAAKAFLDAGTDALFARLADSDAYRSGYPRHQIVLFETDPTDQIFVSPAGDQLKVTPAGSIFAGGIVGIFAGGIVGRLEVGDRGRVGGLSVNLTPRTLGSGPGAVRVNPKVQDASAYRHLGTGQDLHTYYGIPHPPPEGAP